MNNMKRGKVRHLPTVSQPELPVTPLSTPKPELPIDIPEPVTPLDVSEPEMPVIPLESEFYTSESITTDKVTQAPEEQPVQRKGIFSKRFGRNK
ncbi:MAG: hypothetical protein WC479_00740 [Candidatus Izemoplasmatales bacterium]|jgi:hypothetical protein